jgi:fructokinase
LIETKFKNNKKNNMVVGVGEVVWDIFPDGPRLGGAPANFTYYSQLLGKKSILVSRVGDDNLGKETLFYLSRHGLITDYIQLDQIHPTGTVKVVLDSAAVPVFAIQENVAWDYLEKSAYLQSIAEEVSAVCFGSLAFRSFQPRETIGWFLNQLRSDCLRILDINLRPPFYSKELIDSLFRFANVLKVNEVELNIIGSIFYFSVSNETEILKNLLDTYKFKLIALTKGEKGSRLITADRESYHPGFSVEAVDTVGAGDAFTAALVVGLLNSEELDEINEKANWLAGQVCTQKGAWVEVKIQDYRENRKLSNE